MSVIPPGLLEGAKEPVVYRRPLYEVSRAGGYYIYRIIVLLHKRGPEALHNPEEASKSTKN